MFVVSIGGNQAKPLKTVFFCSKKEAERYIKQKIKRIKKGIFMCEKQLNDLNTCKIEEVE